MFTRTMLRATAIRVAGLTKEPGRGHNYRDQDGNLVKLRTAPKGCLLSKAEGSDPSARLPYLEGSAFVVAAVPGPGDVGIEVYKIPTLRNVTDYQTHQAAFAASHPNANEMRALHFDGDPAHPGRGFRIKYREFLLADDQAASASPNTPTPNTPTAMAEEFKQRFAAVLGCSADRIFIVVSPLESDNLRFNF